MRGQPSPMFGRESFTARDTMQVGVRIREAFDVRDLVGVQQAADLGARLGRGGEEGGVQFVGAFLNP